MNKSLQNKKLIVFMFFICCLTVALSFFVPDILLNKQKENTSNKIIIAPESYYVESGNAMARNTSSKLSSSEQIKLISGVWESNVKSCSLDQGFLTENEAVQMAKYALDIYYDLNIFPFSNSANYNNWCSWNAQLYCYTDSLFNTYSAYLWIITFTKFDNSATHTIYMTENGVIVGASTTETGYHADNISYAYTEKTINNIFADNNAKIINIEKAPESTVINPVYPGTDFSNVKFTQIYTLDLVSSSGEIESYYVYQYSGDNIYGFGLSPTPTY